MIAIGQRVTPEMALKQLNSWIVCQTCHNVIEYHNCQWGFNQQPRRHGEGTNRGYQCPEFNRRQFNDRPCAYCGHTIRTSTAAPAALVPQEGGETIMEATIIIDGVEYNLVPTVAAAAVLPTLSIKRNWVVYDVNGNRVDGYKYESRARRNNDARFAGVGYFLGHADTGGFEFVSA